MTKWFVSASKGKTKIRMPMRGQRATTIFNKEIPEIQPRVEAYTCKERLIKDGWTDVKVIKVVQE